MGLRAFSLFAHAAIGCDMHYLKALAGLRPAGSLGAAVWARLLLLAFRRGLGSSLRRRVWAVCLQPHRSPGRAVLRLLPSLTATPLLLQFFLEGRLRFYLFRSPSYLGCRSQPEGHPFNLDPGSAASTVLRLALTGCRTRPLL